MGTAIKREIIRRGAEQGAIWKAPHIAFFLAKSRLCQMADRLEVQWNTNMDTSTILQSRHAGARGGAVISLISFSQTRALAFFRCRQPYSHRRNCERSPTALDQHLPQDQATVSLNPTTATSMHGSTLIELAQTGVSQINGCAFFINCTGP